MSDTCLRCGAVLDPADPAAPAWAWERDGDDVGRICPDCVRRHVRDIEAKLPHEWW